MATIDQVRAIATGCIAALALAFYVAPSTALRSGLPPAAVAQADPDLSHDAALDEIEAGIAPEPLAFDGGFPPALVRTSEAKSPREYPPRSPIDAAVFVDAGVDRVATAEQQP